MISAYQEFLDAWNRIMHQNKLAAQTWFDVDYWKQFNRNWLYFWFKFWFPWVDL